MTFKDAWLMKLKHFSAEALEKQIYPFAGPARRIALIPEQAGNNANGFRPSPLAGGRG